MHSMDTAALGHERDQRGIASPRSRQGSPGSLSVQKVAPCTVGPARFSTKTPDKGQTRERRSEGAGWFYAKPPPRLPKGPRSTRDTTQHPGPGPTAQRARKGLRAQGGKQSAAPSLLPAAPRAQRSGAAPHGPTEMSPGSRSRPPPPARPGQPAAGPEPQPGEENGKAQEPFPGLHLPASKEMHQGVSLAHPRRLHPGRRKEVPGASAPRSRRRSQQGSA